MKAKIIFLVCLLIGISSMSVSAQEKANNGAEQGWYTTTFWSPVYCNGELVDYLVGGELTVHFVFRYVNNGTALAKEVSQAKGTVTSSSGEVFRVREIDKYLYTDHWEVTWHCNLIGDRGNHYIFSMTYNYQTGELTVGKTVCN